MIKLCRNPKQAKAGKERKTMKVDLKSDKAEDGGFVRRLRGLIDHELTRQIDKPTDKQENRQ